MSNPQRAFVGGALAASLAAFIGFQAASGEPRAAALAPRAVETSRVAVFDVLSVSEKLFLSDRYSPERDTRVKAKQDEIGAMEEGVKDVIAKLQGTPQNSPDYQGLYGAYQTKLNEVNAAKQRANEELSAFSTEQFAACYKLAIDTANDLARKNGYTHVIASRVGPLEFRSKELPAALQEVLARPVLMSGAGDDLTPAVMAELKLDQAPAAEAKPDGAEGAAPADKK